MSYRGRLIAAGAAIVIGLPLAACGSSAGPPVLTWFINPDDGGQAAIAEQCTQEANGAYRIETSILPRDASSQREQLARRLAANDSAIDLMSLDPPFIPELAEPGFLAPVPQDVADRVSENVVQGALAGAKWQDELVTIPFWANTQLLWYRKSVAEKAGLDMTKPVTWEDLIKVAREQNVELAVQGAKAESLTVWINALIESAGGHILADEGNPSDEVQLGLESEAGRKAASVIGTIGSEGLGGPGLPTADENASLTLFQSDTGSFMVNWPFVWSAMQAAVEAGTLDQEVLDDIGWAVYPQIDKERPSAPPYGGINIGVGAFSEHVDLAYQAAECIVEPERQSEYFATNGNPPSNTEAYDNPDVQKAFPMAGIIRDSLKAAAPRPQTPYYNEVSLGLQETWHPPASVNPDTTPQAATELITAVLRGDRLL